MSESTEDNAEINAIFEEADSVIKRQNEDYQREKEKMAEDEDPKTKRKKKRKKRRRRALLTAAVIVLVSLIAVSALLVWGYHEAKQYVNELQEVLIDSYQEMIDDIKAGEYDEESDPAMTEFLHGYANLITEEDVEDAFQDFTVSSFFGMMDEDADGNYNIDIDLSAYMLPEDKEDEYKELLKQYQKNETKCFLMEKESRISWGNSSFIVLPIE